MCVFIIIRPFFSGTNKKTSIEKKCNIQARAQIVGYYARSGECRKYDKRLTNILADKVLDLLLREDYGKMPVLRKLTTYQEIEEYNTATIDMGNIGNKSLPETYYDHQNFHFNEKYYDFLSYFIDQPKRILFNYSFPKVKPLF